MWFGTRLGMDIYDGSKVKSFYPDPSDPNSLPDAYVSAIAESPDGSIWIGTSKGICAFDYENGIFSYRKGINIPVKSYISSMVFDNHGNLWFTAVGLYRYDTSTNDVRHYSEVGDNSLSRIIFSSTNELWIASFSGDIYRYDETTDSFQVYHILSKDGRNPMTRISGIAEFDRNRLLISTTDSGFKVFNIISHEISTVEILNVCGKNEYIHTLLTRSNGDVWIATENGIYVIPYNEMDSINSQFRPRMIHIEKDGNNTSLSDNAVHAMFEDRENGVWVGTYFGGMNYYASALQDFRQLKTEDSHLTPVVREIIPDSDGMLWIATENCGLFSYALQSHDGLKAVNLSYQGRETTKNIHTLLLDGNRLWLGTFDEGIYIYDIESREIIRHYYEFSLNFSFNDKAVVKIFRASNGDILVGNMSGLYIYDDREDRFTVIEGASGIFVHWIYQSLDGSIWIASLHNGLFQLIKEKGKYRIKHIPTEYIDITTMYADSRGNFWVGTNTHGMFLLDIKNGKEIPSALNVCKTNKVIGKIVEDRNSCLWISTSDGLYSYNLISGEEMRYGVHNSLPTDQFNFSSGLLAPDGMMYFGTMKGLITFDPYKLNRQKKTYKVFFADLACSESAFSVNFAVPIYSSSQSLWYRYRLDGVDNDWTVVQGAQNVKYSNLKPGTYKLTAQASTINGLWSDSEEDCSVLEINIEYPPLLSPVAIIIYVLILVVVTVFAIRAYRRHVIQQRRHHIDNLRNEMDKELMSDKIKFFTDITHEIRTPLTLIMGGLERMERVCKDSSVTIMRQNVNRLHNLVNQLLDFRKMEASSYMVDIRCIDITPIVNNIYTSFIPVSEQHGIDYRLSTGDGSFYVMADPEAVTKIVNNMLSNAFKYCEHSIEVSLSVADGKVEVRVSNDGALISHENLKKVFMPFHQIYHDGVNTTINGTGLGLPLAKKMAELQNGSFFYDEGHSQNSFVLSLPEARDESGNGEAAAQDASNKGSDHTLSETILVVDDEEQLRQFVAEELSEKYRVLQAENGRQALDLLDRDNISLIITDIMMPVLDGIELCRQVKADIRYCHIPVIMLTAKVSLTDHIEALNSKSDAYIEKPFHTSELMAQVGNLLANRKLLCTSYVRSPYAMTENVAANNLDNDFLKDITDFILSTMLSQAVNVDALAEHANMSRPTFYRKLKGLTSLSPLEFIHYCKLKKAAELLSNGRTTIKEVSEKTGFSSVSHFTACFTKQFGITPGKFVSQNDKNLTMQAF